MYVDLNPNDEIIKNYTSESQKIRVLSERWAENNLYCPICGENISKYPNNKPVADFFCEKCGQDFELKSKKENLGKKIVDGAYNSMIERIGAVSNPNFMVMTYKDYKVNNLLIIPNHFFTPEIIEKRKPLSITAKRSGWIGCNIMLDKIPSSGRVFYIKDSKIMDKIEVIKSFNKTMFLKENTKLKGWLLDIMLCIDKIGKKQFSLDDLYVFERDLKEKHNENKFIKDKIRQQLQFLRDRGYIKFLSKGNYCLI